MMTPQRKLSFNSSS